MPNVQKVLQEEIKRLAKLEARDYTQKLFDDVRDLKDLFRDLRDRLEDMERTLRRVEKVAFEVYEEETTPEPDEVENARITAKTIQRLREKFDMTQAEFGELLDVHPITVSNWENHDGGTIRLQRDPKSAVVEARKIGKKEAWRRLEENRELGR